MLLLSDKIGDGKNLDNGDALLMIGNSSHTLWMAVCRFCHLVQDVGVGLLTNDTF